MKLSEWIAARPEVDAKIKATVEAHRTFGDFLRGSDYSLLNSDEKIEEWRQEQRRLFVLFDNLSKEADAMMPSMGAIVSIDEYSYGQPLLAEDMDLLGWEFDTDFYFKEPRGHAAFLKYRAKGAQVSFYTQVPQKVNIKDAEQ